MEKLCTYHLQLVKATNIVGDGAWSRIYQFIIVDQPSEPLNLLVDPYDFWEPLSGK